MQQHIPQISLSILCLPSDGDTMMWFQERRQRFSVLFSPYCLSLVSKHLNKKRLRNYIQSPLACQVPWLKWSLWLTGLVYLSFAKDLKTCANHDAFVCPEALIRIQWTETWIELKHSLEIGLFLIINLLTWRICYTWCWMVILSFDFGLFLLQGKKMIRKNC